MPISNPGDQTGGHRFTETAKSGDPKCGVCGLVWRREHRRPSITCPEVPLDEVFDGWSKTHGES